jgi:chromosomal replication initiation ATPase DnaA
LQQTRNRDLTVIWDAVRDELRATLPPSAFESWLEPLRPIGVQGTRLYVQGPERVRDWFERRYGSIAAAAVRRRVPGITEIVFSEPGRPPRPRSPPALSVTSTSIAS